MNKRLYMVYDLIASTVLPTVILESADAPAMRSFNDALANSQSLLGQHPADFNLLCIGEVTDQGILLPTGDLPVIATGAAWLNLKGADNA
ncbi:MAG: nonstructural protein [Microvirus sp.]|nr:MAG: nonstructural protein [Microvirus sp.]